jgi:NAD-dependent dihydropyrimidine dehydrogenase PreA subunit
MAVREVIEIDQNLCDGCGDCITACAEGAIAVIDGKARLVSDIYCDGLGACLGHCPQGALTVVTREAGAFDEKAVESRLATLQAEKQAGPAGPTLSVVPSQPLSAGRGCPGSRPQMYQAVTSPPSPSCEGASSQLSHWPIQLHLVPPTAPFFRDREVLLAADCVAFAVADFHHRFLAGSALAIACPKLDNNQETYLEKLKTMIDEAGIRRLKVMVMEVPCCGGLVRLTEQALRRASRNIEVECLVVGTRGHILGEYRIAG